MAKFLLTDAKVEVNGVDLSDHSFSLDTPQTREQVDVSGFSPTAAKEFLPGSKEESIVVGFLQDFASSKVHQTLQPLFAAGTSFMVSLLPDSDTAVSASNPRLSGTCALFEYNGLSGELNARSETVGTFRPTTTAGLTWGTT